MNENEQKTKNVVRDFIREYKNKSKNESNLEWLNRQFDAYPDLWESEEKRRKDAADIVEHIDLFHKNKAELTSHLASGKSHESYIISKIEAGATVSGTVSVSKYAGEIDTALSKANQEMVERIFTKDGSIDMNPQLKGNIMETDHVKTFNIDAAAKESSAVVEVKLSYERNSVDIGVTKADGAHQRYQSKCCKDSDRSELAFEHGDYVAQRKLVTKGQTSEVTNSTDHLEADGVKSEARTHEEYKKMQEDAQQKGEIHEYEWNDINKVAMAKAIGKKAAIAGVLAVGFQGARILGRRMWNFVTGKDNQSIDEDLKEFVTSSIQSAGGAGIAVATTGGITIAVKSGWLGQALKTTPVGHIANAVCVGIENTKILYKLGKGELTGREALDQAGNATCSLVGGLAGGTKGAAIGATLGATLGPVGAVIGGIAGGVIGGLAGSTVGEVVYSGAKKVCQAIGSVASSAWHGIKSVGRALNPFNWF